MIFIPCMLQPTEIESVMLSNLPRPPGKRPYLVALGLVAAARGDGAEADGRVGEPLLLGDGHAARAERGRGGLERQV